VFSTLRKSPNIFGMCGLATHRCVRLLGKFGGRLVHKFHLALKSSGADPSARAQACGSGDRSEAVLDLRMARRGGEMDVLGTFAAGLYHPCRITLS
jgi:hypothetical protein